MANIMPYDRRGRSLWGGFDDMERMFSRAFGESSRAFRTDIKDEGDHYQLTAELPGYAKEDINIEIQGDNLMISAATSGETSEEGDNYVRRERHSGSVTRSFDVTGIDTDNIKASYENGVLQLELPKSKDDPSKKKKISL